MKGASRYALVGGDYNTVIRQGLGWHLIHVRHDNLVAFCLQRQQKRLRARRAYMRNDGDVQHIIGERINGNRDVHPVSTMTTRHRHPLLVITGQAHEGCATRFQPSNSRPSERLSSRARL